jgi:hypothetical protein
MEMRDPKPRAAERPAARRRAELGVIAAAIRELSRGRRASPRARPRIRTETLFITNEVLYQLS